MLLEMFNQSLFMSKTSQSFHFLAVFNNKDGRNAGYLKALGQFRAVFYVTTPKLYLPGYRLSGLFDKGRFLSTLDIPWIPETDNAQTLPCFSFKISVIKHNFLHTHSDHLSSKSW